MPDGDANAERMQMALRRFELPLLQFATRITGDREGARGARDFCEISKQRGFPKSGARNLALHRLS
jgi:hypothetical protein